MKEWNAHERNEDKEVEILDFNDKQKKKRRDKTKTSTRGAKYEQSRQMQTPRKAKNERRTTTRNKEYAIVTYVFLALFICMTGWIIYFMQFKSEDFINNSYNARLAKLSDYTVRGDILANDGTVLATTNVDEAGNETRKYPYGSVFAHAVGYSVNANSEQVLARVFHAVGLKVELLSGEEEAILSFSGAVHASPFADGCLFDLGGGSTEVVAFRERKPYYAKSMNIGCLNLYKRYVKKIWPKKLEIEEMKLFIERNLAEAALPEHPQPLLIGVGGTARSLLELINLREKRDASHREITMEELHTCVSFLLKRDTNAKDAVLKKCPDRIHTIIPGALLMQALAKKMKAERLYISEYGVREGYLWKEFIKTTI